MYLYYDLFVVYCYLVIVCVCLLFVVCLLGRGYALRAEFYSSLRLTVISSPTGYPSLWMSQPMNSPTTNIITAAFTINRYIRPPLLHSIVFVTKKRECM